MKKTVIIFIGFLMLSVVSAQAGLRFGVKGGVNLAKVSFSESDLNSDNFTGFQVGAIMELIPASGFGIDASVLYSQHGLKFKDETGQLGTLEIPANLKFKFNLIDILGAYATAGPYINLKLTDDLKDLKQNLGDQLESKSFGAGLNFGLGVEILKNIQVGVNYKLGLTNDYSNIKFKDMVDLDGKIRVWSITAAYFF